MGLVVERKTTGATSDGIKLQCIAIAIISSFLMFAEYMPGTFAPLTGWHDWQRSDTKVSTAFVCTLYQQVGTEET